VALSSQRREGRYRYRVDVSIRLVCPHRIAQALYTNLRPGNYTFHVTAANNDGVWNEQGAALAFSKSRRHSYRRAGFLALVCGPPV